MEKNKNIVDMDKKIIEEAEWCFQFDEEEPQLLAVSPPDKTGEPLTITLTIANQEGQGLVFSKDGKRFAIFARPITENGRALQEEQQKLMK